jgi:hypothetical protein
MDLTSRLLAMTAFCGYGILTVGRALPRFGWMIAFTQAVG